MKHVATLAFGNGTIIIEEHDGESSVKLRMTLLNIHGCAIDIVDTPNDYLLVGSKLDLSDFEQEHKIKVKT